MTAATAPQSSGPKVLWAPQPGPQTAFITCPVFEVVYGGARGGGKTDGVLGEWAIHASIYGQAAKGLMFRRQRTQLIDTIRRAQELYLPIGAQWREQDKVFIMPGGGELRMAYVENDSDAEAYQGHSYTRLYPEELTNFPDPRPIMKLKATLRSAEGVPVGMRATCNPGGPGHVWVKHRYIDPAPRGFKVVEDDDGMARVFIPARVQDNPALLNSDPQYIARLKQTGSAELVRAWLEGDWDVIVGAYFDCWRPEMVIRPFRTPSHWLRFRSIDWGSARPFSVGWWAVATETIKTADGTIIPANAMVRYREWYGASEPNVGLKMTAEEVAGSILDRETKEERNDGIRYTVADPSMFATDGGPSLAERFHNSGVPMRPGDNRRISDKGRMGGWDQMRARMVGEEFDGIERPMIYCFDTCVDSIRTIPALQHDEKRPEDVDTDGEDHAGDEWRYACMSRPYTLPKPKAALPIDAQPTFGQIVDEHIRRKGGRQSERI